MNYKDAAGKWQQIDTRLKKVTGAGALGRAVSPADEGWTITSGDAQTSFAGHADGAPLVSMKVGQGLSVGFAVHDAAHAPGEADESTVTYRAVRPSADMKFIAGGTSVKELLVLNTPDAPTEWLFPLHLQGLTPRIDTTGAVLLEDASGATRARIPAGWMEDSNLAPNSNQGEISSGVSYELVEVGGSPALKVSLDTTWLQDPERVFPVKVDPTVTSVTPTAASSGTFVEYPYNQNFASDTNIKVGTYDGGGHKTAGFLRFAGVESSLKNAWVVNASLALYNTWSYSCTARPVTVHAITSNWSESTTSTYPGPATGSALGSKSFTHGWRPAGQEAYPCGGANWESIPLGPSGRQLVNDWTHGRKPNYGLAVKASTTDSNAWKHFGSDDYPNGKPSLDVTWTKYGATYKPVEFTTPMTATTEGSFKITVTNQGQQTWVKNGNVKLKYELYDAAGKLISDASKIRWTPMPSDIAPGASVTLDAKIAPLTPATYTLVWTMDDYNIASFTSAGVPGSAVKVDAVNVPPQLTGEAPPSGSMVDTLTPTLWASANDRDRYPKALTYQFEVCEVEGKDTRKNCQLGTASTAQTWTVPKGWLKWSKTYAWYSYASDSKDKSVRPGSSFITTQVPQPAIAAHLGGTGTDAGRSFGSRSGNYASAATDAAVATIGPELSVTRTYNSQDPRRTNAFGAGWATRWDMRAVAEDDGSVVVTRSDGSQVRFGRNSDGTFSAPAGSVEALTAVSGGGWSLRAPNASMYTFDAAGLLTRIVDGFGRQQTLTYISGRLATATDVTSKRSLTFTWSGTKVATVSTSGPGALTWTYTYSGDKLVKVCPPNSATACTVYQYADASRYRSTVLDAAPIAYWRLNDSETETAASDAISRTGQVEGHFRDVDLGRTGALTGTFNKAGYFDGSGSYAELPEASLSSSTVLSTELWFKTTKPGVLLGFQDGRLTDGRPDHYDPVLAVDSAGKLRGAFETADGWQAPMSSTGTVTDGAWHHAVLTSTGTSQVLYLDGNAVGTRTGAVDHNEKTFTYLGAGYSSWGWDGTNPEGVRYFTGTIDEVAVYHSALGSDTVKDHYTARAGAPVLTQVTLPSGRVSAKVTYDPDTERATTVTDANGGTWKISEPSYSSGSAAYSRAMHVSGPVNYWRLGEGSGATAVDEIENGGDGSYGEGVTLGSVGAFMDGDDASVTLDGAEGAIEVPSDSLSGATALSAEMWFRTGTPGSVLLGLQNTEIGTTPTKWNPSLLIDSAGKLRGHFWDGSSANPIVSSASVADNEWHHVVLTGNSSGQTMYLDGRKVGFQAGVVKPETLLHAYLGAGYASSGWDGAAAGTRYFAGQLDEAAFYNKALTATAVGNHYRARTQLVAGNGDQYRGTVTADAPAGFWRMDETSGTTAHSQVAATGSDGTFTQATLGTTGAFGTGDGTAVQFDGDGYVQLPGIGQATTDVAVEVWFRTTKPGVIVGDQSTSIAGATTTSGTWTPVLYVGADGKLHGEYPSVGVTRTNASTETVTDNEWHHAVISAKGDIQTLYLDGTQVALKTEAPITHQSNNRTYIGAGFARTWPSAPADVSYFTGQIDEVAIYQHALTGAQISEHYRARTASSVSSLASTVTVTAPTGGISSTTYDALRGQRKVAHTNAEGDTTTYTYDTGGFLHTVTDPNGHSTVTGHDAQGNTVSRTTCRDSDSCWTTYTDHYFNAADPLDLRNGKPTAVRDARSAGPDDDRYKTTTSYTSHALPFAVTLADGRQSTTTYTTGSETAVDGGTVPARLVASQKTPGGAVTSYSYFANGDVARVTQPSGLVTHYTYDALGRKTTEKQVSDTFPNGITTTYTHDAMSRVTSEAGPGVKNEITGVTHTAVLTRTFDADGNLLTESTEDTTGGDPKATTTYHYDSHGLADTVTDALGNVTSYQYDAAGRVTRTTDALGNATTQSYTPTGRAAETVLKDWTGDPSGQTRDLVLQSNAYDPAGRLASTTDAMGATTSYTYFDDGLPATTTAKQVTQADGTRHDIVLETNTYDGAGNLTKQVTGDGTRTQTYAVDATSRVTQTVFDPSGLNRATEYTYDDDNRVTEQRQKAAGTLLRTQQATYDKTGNVLTSTLVDGTTPRTTKNTYDDRGLLLTTVTPRGNVTGASATAFTTAFRYDELGRLVTRTAPTVTVETSGTAPASVKPAVTNGYDTYGATTEVRDENGNTTRTQVDRLGRPLTVTLPAYTPPGATTPISAVQTTTYDVLGRVASTTDPLNRTTSYAYDQLGQLKERTDPVADAAAAQLGGNQLNTNTALNGGGISRWTWTPTGLQLSATTPTGARSEATYDELGRQLTATTVERHPTQQNLTSRFAWDDAGNQTGSTTPAGLTTTATYNKAGQVLKVTAPGSSVTQVSYDGLGRRTQAIDPTNRKTVFTYDAADNVIETADYGTGSTVLRSAKTQYDVEGNPTSVTPPAGGPTTYTYDALGRITQQTEKTSDTASITASYGYDAAGHRTRLTDGRGKATYYTFNSWGLPESTIEPATTQHWNPDVRTWTVVYDAAGQAVTELLPGGVKRQRTYDGLGRLTGETGSGTAVATRPRTLAYDLDGRLTGVAGDGVLAGNTYTYNDRGQLLGSDGPGGRSQYAYDADGNMTTRTDAAGTTAFTYDTAGRLDTTTDPLTGTQLQTDYDAAGRPTVEQYARPATGGTYTIGAKRSYTYDSLGRLAKDSVTRTATGTEVEGMAYDYDLADRLTKKTTTGTAGAAVNTYGYDLAGRMTTWTNGSTTTPYEWDEAGNLTRQGTTTGTYDFRNRLETWGTETFAYSARGTEKTITEADGDKRQINSDAFERTVTNGTSTFTYDSLDRVMTHNGSAFTYDGGSNNLVTDATTSYTRTPEGGLLASATTATPGSARLAVTDQHTDLTASLTADGTTLSASRAYDPFGKTTATSGTNPSLGYQSGWTDASTGEVNMASRWYQPGIGSFTSRDTWQLDPTGSSLNANRYAYGAGSPLNGTDPTGHYLDSGNGGRTLAPSRPVNITWRPVTPPPAPGWRVPGWVGPSLRFGGRLLGGVLGTVAGIVINATPVGGVWCSRIGNALCHAIHTTRPDSARNLFCDTHGWAAQCGGGYRPWPSAGPGSGPSPSGHGGGGGGNEGGGGGGPIAPPAPPIDQNPNNGPNPAPAPTRPVPKPDWDPRRGVWDPTKGWDMIVGSLSILNMVTGNSNGYTPNQLPSPYSAPGSNPGSGTGPDDSGDCRVNGQGWKDYGNVDASNGNRATGITACLDKREIIGGTAADPSRTKGYQWAQGFVEAFGFNPTRTINACHLLANTLGGSGTKPENLSACARPANYYTRDVHRIEENMRHYEKLVKSEVQANNVVKYSVTPMYSGPRTVPYEYAIDATVWRNGVQSKLIYNATVVNELMPGGLYNLGRQSVNGHPVPFGNMK
ncbi:LamG-like jellyroll fold domain-containing protein [Streptomyces sp. NPDC101132]|uniref:LamG-like jellyroll fold domain-containing protein n=1 Tax=Streptomyces sp. NPDC101132 TaxID=3366110 RepID=UPI0038090F28